MDSYETAFTRYLHENLTDDEEDPGETPGLQEVEHKQRSAKLGMNKPDIIFEWKSGLGPILPKNCLRERLEEKKHIMRCFLKAHYGE